MLILLRKTATFIQVKNEISLGLLAGIFKFFKKLFNVPNSTTLERLNNNPVDTGMENLPSLACKIWELIPHDLRHELPLSVFKCKIKTWTNNIEK